MSLARSDTPDDPGEAQDPEGGRRAVLVVDPDRVAQRMVAAALEPFGWGVEAVRTGEGALELLRQQHVDAVVAEVALDDMPGRALIDRAWEVCGATPPAFVFLTSDARLETRASLLRGGAAAYITKPFAPEELRAHLDGSLVRRNRERREPLAPTAAIAGRVEQLDLRELVLLLERGRHTGVLEVAVGSVLGRLRLRDGVLVGAELGGARGEHAVRALLRSGRGWYRFDVRPVEGIPAERSLGELAAEVARLAPRPHATRARSLAELGVVKREIPLHRVRSPARSRLRDRPELVHKLIGPVADRYLLGELRFDEQDPAAWDRLYEEGVLVELWAGLSDGVGALLEVASPPGRDAIVALLSGEAQEPRLHLTARGGASLVVRLVDIEGSEASVRRHPPDLILVAPPGGELFAVGPARLSELTLMAALGRLPSIVALGGAALHASVGRIALERGVLELLDVAPALGERRGQLRDVLVAALRRWLP